MELICGLLPKRRQQPQIESDDDFDVDDDSVARYRTDKSSAVDYDESFARSRSDKSSAFDYEESFVRYRVDKSSAVDHDESSSGEESDSDEDWYHTNGIGSWGESDTKSFDVDSVIQRRTASTMLDEWDDSSDTDSDAILSGDESDIEGLQVMRAARHKPSVFEEVQSRDINECIKGLQKTISKSPCGRSLFASPREHYFSIVFGSGIEAQTRITQPKTILEQTSSLCYRVGMCYWENQEASKHDEPLGSVPIASFTEVIHKLECNGSQVKVLAKNKNDHEGDFVLTLRFGTAMEAASWASDLRAVVQASQTQQAPSFM